MTLYSYLVLYDMHVHVWFPTSKYSGLYNQINAHTHRIIIKHWKNKESMQLSACRIKICALLVIRT